MKSIGVLGAGSWGTALAVHAATADYEVVMWARDAALAVEMQSSRRNQKYLPDTELPPRIRVTGNRSRELSDLSTVLVVVPSHGFREAVRHLLSVSTTAETLTLISATKGIETESTSRMSEVVEQEASEGSLPVRFAVLSGPTFAAELAQGQPSAAVHSLRPTTIRRVISVTISLQTRFRLYSSDDVVGRRARWYYQERHSHRCGNRQRSRYGTQHPGGPDYARAS